MGEVATGRRLGTTCPERTSIVPSSETYPETETKSKGKTCGTQLRFYCNIVNLGPSVCLAVSRASACGLFVLSRAGVTARAEVHGATAGAQE